MIDTMEMDVPWSPPSRMKTSVVNLLHRLHPRCCLYSDCDDVFDFDAVSREILRDLHYEKTRSSALQRLFDQTDLPHQYNRIPLVCTSKWDIVNDLAQCLSYRKDRRQACLVLNNLSIPFENKAVMVFGPSGTRLLDAVLNAMIEAHPESYLCCILFMNLTYLEDAKLCLVKYVYGGANEDPLENQRSLLRTVELVLKSYNRFLARKVLSVEREAIRWATGLLRNLTSIQEGASLVARTAIPSYILSYVRNSRKPLHQWTQDSLEDLSLQVLTNLATHPDSLACFKKIDAESAFDTIVGQGGIHDVRASFLRMRLGHAYQDEMDEVSRRNRKPQ